MGESFKVKEFLGEGLSGRLHVVKDNTTHRHFAVKALQKEVIKDFDNLRASAIKDAHNKKLRAEFKILQGLDYVSVAVNNSRSDSQR